MKKDIADKSDIEELVNVFYGKLKEDDLLRPYFSKIGDWEKFLKTVKSFWENVLFFTGTYSGNPMEIHRTIHTRMPMTEAHFEVWLKIFNATVDELFEGGNANATKQRANSIATVMRIKIMG